MDKPEAWKAIPEFEGYYEASSHGRIRSLVRYVPNHLTGGKSRVGGNVLKSFTDKGGHLRLIVCVDGVQYNRFVHRLVAEAFLGECPEGLCALHNLTGMPNPRTGI